MYLGGAFLGVSFMTEPLSPAVSTLGYDEMTLFGGGIFDKVWIRNRQENQTYIDNLTVANYSPVWDGDTVFLAEFDGNLSAGNITNLTSPIVNWIVNKRNIKDNLFTKIKTIPNTDSSANFEVRDYEVRRGETYEYEIFPETANEVAEPLLSEQVKSDYFSHFLIDLENNIEYRFDLEVSTGGFSADYDQTEYQTYGKYNSYNQGDRDFVRGSISAIVPKSLEIDGIEQPSEFVEQFQNFINNGKIKLLKTRKGDVWRVITNNFNRGQFNDGIGAQLDVLTFDFMEIEATEGV